MREGFAFVAFTGKGAALAERLRAELGGTVRVPGEGFSLSAWTAENFPEREALIFIGAAGIALRAVAPHIRSKAEDPAVLCVDETGRFVIPLLSGHLGGANELARLVAALTGGTAVITTATDLNGAFAVDLWAKKQGMTVLQPERIRQVSSAVLRGETERVFSPYPVAGEQPAQLRPADSAEETEVSAQSANPASAEGERLVLQTLSSGNPGYGQTALSSAGTQTHNAEESFRRDDRSYLESGRKEIYWSALKSLQMEPRRLLLGSSWEHLMDCSHELIREQVVHFHNDFLQALNLVGLPGFALLLLFFFFMAKTGFTILLDAGNRFALCEKMLVVPVAVFFIYVMLECVLTREYLDFRSLMFYLLCGFMTGTAKRQ